MRRSHSNRRKHCVDTRVERLCGTVETQKGAQRLALEKRPSDVVNHYNTSPNFEEKLPTLRNHSDKDVLQNIAAFGNSFADILVRTKEQGMGKTD